MKLLAPVWIVALVGVATLVFGMWMLFDPDRAGPFLVRMLTWGRGIPPDQLEMRPFFVMVIGGFNVGIGAILPLACF